MFMWIVFAFLFGSTKGIAQQPFIIYVITGLLPLGWLTSSISGGPKVLRRYGDLLVTSKLPAVVWPMRLVLFSFADMILALPVVAALAIAFHIFTGEPGISWGSPWFRSPSCSSSSCVWGSR